MINMGAKVPLVSICVPTYNGSRFIRQCLDSVIGQTFGDKEILVVDDGSTDDTLQIVREYAARNPRFRVVVNDQNLGLVGNWNRCVELARGEWIKFVFQDDLIAPTCLEKMLAASEPDAAIIACRRDFVFDEDTPEETRGYYLEHPSPDTVFSGASHITAQDICEAVIDHIGVNFVGEPSAVLLRRDVFTRLGLFNPDLIMICDTEYWTRVASHTGLVYVPETLATFRVHAGSTSAHNFARRQYRMTIDGIALLHEYAFNDAYASLRKAAAQRSPSFDFTDLLAKRATGTRWLATDAAHRERSPDTTLIEEWERFLRNYPRIKDLLPKGDTARAGLLTRLCKRVFG
jgi:glycosyltransferase involved in cell wall biosynthesis